MNMYARLFGSVVVVLLFTSAASASLIAYNDFGGSTDYGGGNGTGYLGGNVTAFTKSTGGFLKDYATGLTTSVNMSLSCGTLAWTAYQGAALAAGKDAYNVFNGIVNPYGLIGSNSSGASYGPYTITFTGLNAGEKYDIVLYGDRAWPGTPVPDATTRASDAYTISGAAAYQNISSTGISGATATMNVGNNTAAGYVAHYTNIQPGGVNNNSFTITLTSPNVDGDGAWRLNAMRLEAIDAVPEPVTLGLLGLGGLGILLRRRSAR